MIGAHAEERAASSRKGSFLLRLGRDVAGGMLKVHTVGDGVAASAIFLVMLLVVADVVGRNVLGAPVPGSFEISESLMVFIVFLAVGYVEATGGNIRVELLGSRVSERKRHLLHALTCLLGILFFGLIAWDTWRYALESWAVREFMTGTLPLPLYPAKLAVPVGCAMLVVQFLIGLAGSLAVVLGGTGTGQ